MQVAENGVGDLATLSIGESDRESRATSRADAFSAHLADGEAKSFARMLGRSTGARSIHGVRLEALDRLAL